MSTNEKRRPLVAIIGSRGYPSYYGGFETAVRTLAPYLVEQGWDVIVYGRAGTSPDIGRAGDSRVRSITTRGIESKALSTLSYGFTSSLDAVFRRKPDVALVMNVANGFFLPLFKARGIPTLVNVDGIEWDRDKWGRLAKAVFRLGARLTAKYGTRLVYDAQAIARIWKKEFGRGGVFIPYGGDDPGDLPVPAGFSHRGYALIVARFVPENSILEFLEAAPQIAAEYPVVIVGSAGYGGVLDERVRRLAESHENIYWLGHVSDDRLLFALLKHAGAYFHGHSVGGTNPALVQALACGAPVVARDTVYNREVLGAKGIYVQPTPVAIAEGLIAILSDPDLQDHAEATSLDRSRLEYNWATVCGRYEDALSELAHARSL
ncbi:glycosyltransferase [Rathayibacter sp. VKM Ac-2759]|nr:glycosyltransferase [Rathayibacter sp. VKM Ac-2759]